MALDLGVKVTQGVGSGVTLPYNQPVAIAGTYTEGTATIGTVYKVETADQAESLFGTIADGGTIPLALNILQRYGSNTIYVSPFVEGADNAETDDNIEAALDLLSTYPQVDIITVAGYNTTATVAKLKAIADSIRAIAIVNFDNDEAVGDVYTKRGTASGEFNYSDPRIIYTFPSLLNANDNTQVEDLSLHLMGILVMLTGKENYGKSPLNETLLEVDGIPSASAMTMSLSDETADSEQLVDDGIVTVNLDPDGNYILWGARTSLYLTDQSDVLTYINAVRARDEISQLVEARSLKFLSQESSYPTALLLRESYIDLLAVEAAKTAIKNDYKVTFNEAQSDYTLGRLNYTILFTPWLPVQLITTQVKITLTIGG